MFTPAMAHQLAAVWRSVYIQALAAGLSLRAVVDYATAWNSVSAQLRGALPPTEDLAKAQQNVLDLANLTGQAIEPTGKLYAGLNRSLRGTIDNQQELLDLTKLIAQSFVVSGANSENAAAAILQLNQAFGSGVLRGDEFNSVMENNQRLAQALADGIGPNGVPVGALRQMAEEGKLTTEVVAKALLSQRAKIETEFAAMPRSVSQAFTALRNQFVAGFGRGDEVAGFTKAIAGVIDLLAKRVPELTPQIVAFGQALAAMFDWLRDNPGAIETGLELIVKALELMIAAKVLGGVVSLGQNLFALWQVIGALVGAVPLLATLFTGTMLPALAAVGTGLKALSLLFLTNPIGIAILAIAAAIGLAIAYWDDLVQGFRIWSATVDQIFLRVVKTIKDAFIGVRDFFVTLFTVTIPAAWAGFINRLADLFAQAKAKYGALLADVQALWTGLWDSVKQIGQAALDYLVKLFTGFVDTIKSSFGSVKDSIVGLFSSDQAAPNTGDGPGVIRRADGGYALRRARRRLAETARALRLTVSRPFADVVGLTLAHRISLNPAPRLPGGAIGKAVGITLEWNVQPGVARGTVTLASSMGSGAADPAASDGAADWVADGALEPGIQTRAGAGFSIGDGLVWGFGTIDDLAEPINLGQLSQPGYALIGLAVGARAATQFQHVRAGFNAPGSDVQGNAQDLLRDRPSQLRFGLRPLGSGDTLERGITLTVQPWPAPKEVDLSALA